MSPEYQNEDEFDLGEIDLEELAEKIVSLILQEIEIENERTGR